MVASAVVSVAASVQRLSATAIKASLLYLRREFRFLIVRGESECGAAVMVGMAGLAAKIMNDE